MGRPTCGRTDGVHTWVQCGHEGSVPMTHSGRYGHLYTSLCGSNEHSGNLVRLGTRTNARAPREGRSAPSAVGEQEEQTQSRMRCPCIPTARDAGRPQRWLGHIVHVFRERGSSHARA